MDAKELVEGLGLRFDEDGVCRLSADDEPLRLEPSLDDKHVYLHGVVGEPPAEQKKQLFSLALSGNLYGKETGYGTLAYDESISSLVMIDRIPLHGLHKQEAELRIAQFVHYLKAWKRVLANPNEHVDRELSLQAHLGGLVGEQNLDIFFA